MCRKASARAARLGCEAGSINNNDRIAEDVQVCSARHGFNIAFHQWTLMDCLEHCIYPHRRQMFGW
jgi:hypothetical protein